MKKTTAVHAATLAIAFGLLAGCAGDTTRSDSVVAQPEPETTTATLATKSDPPKFAPARQAEADRVLPETTGIKACDDYLSNYVVCHRVVGTYNPATLDERHAKLRLSLLEDSVDPASNVTLEARCTNLAQLMTDALDGRSCEDVSLLQEPIAGVDAD